MEQVIFSSPNSSLSPSNMFAIFESFCKDKALLEKLGEFKTANASFYFSREEAFAFVDQLLEFTSVLEIDTAVPVSSFILIIA